MNRQEAVRRAAVYRGLGLIFTLKRLGPGRGHLRIDVAVSDAEVERLRRSLSRYAKGQGTRPRVPRRPAIRPEALS